MWIPGPHLNILGSPQFVARKYLFDDRRIKRKPPKTTTEDESKPGFLCWGVVGDLPSAQQVPSVGFDVVGEEHTEISRETTPIRIENPDDPSQYVDALQTNKMKLEKKENQPKKNSDTKDANFDEGNWTSDEQVNAFTPAGSGSGPPTTVTETWTFHPPERAL
jgi:hypothetical protein